MNRCPACGAYTRHGGVCQRDGSPLEPCDGVVDRYQLTDQVGVGGMGTVYKAVHTLLDNRVVAIKLLHRQLSQNPEVVNRFFREARAASRAENEHIVEVIDFGVSDEGDSFLVMEFLEGPSLRDLMEEGPLPLRRALAIGVQIAEGLYAAHRRGIVHRDLKPENVVLIRRNGNEFAKLLDFGIAKLTEQQETGITVAGMVVGTPTYMSPEQAGGETVDHRTDIYALGTILYEMLTGRPPFVGDTTKEVLLCQLTQPPQPPRQLRPEIPDTVETVILRALHKDREQRPQTMLRFAYELRDALLKKRKAALEAGEPSSNRSAAGGPTDDSAELEALRPNALLDEDPLETTLDVQLPPSLKRLLPVLGLGAGLVLGILITVLLMRTDAKPPRAAGGTVGGGAAATTSPPTASRQDAAAPTASVRPDAGHAVAVRRTPDRSEVARPAHRPRRGQRRHPAHAGRRAHPHRKAEQPPPVSTSRTKATVASIPANAEVYDGETRLGRTPLKVGSDQARKLTVHTLGYNPKTIQIPAGATRTYTVKLRKSTMSWEVLSLSQLKKMLDQGQISRFTYNRRKADLVRTRDQKIVELKVKYKMGHLTKEQYERAAKAVRDSYR
jgi:serine/threonine protein kinase